MYRKFEVGKKIAISAAVIKTKLLDKDKGYRLSLIVRKWLVGVTKKLLLVYSGISK